MTTPQTSDIPAAIQLTPAKIFDAVLRLKLAINPLILAAQTYHETGNYKHCCGKGNTNLAGIKSTKAWMDGTIPWSTKREILLPTQEYDKATGQYITIQAKFRWYGEDYELCLRDIERIITTKPWFADAAQNNDCCWAYLAGIIAKWSPGPNAKLLEPGWATGHKYFDSIVRVVMQIAPDILGAEWDTRLRSALCLATTRATLSKEHFLTIYNALKPRN